MTISPKRPSKKRTKPILMTTVILEERSRPWLNLSLCFDIQFQFVDKGIKKLFEIGFRHDRFRESLRQNARRYFLFYIRNGNLLD